MEFSLSVGKNLVKTSAFGSLVVKIRLKTVNNSLQDGLLNSPSVLEINQILLGILK